MVHTSTFIILSFLHLICTQAFCIICMFNHKTNFLLLPITFKFLYQKINFLQISDGKRIQERKISLNTQLQCIKQYLSLICSKYTTTSELQIIQNSILLDTITHLELSKQEKRRIPIQLKFVPNNHNFFLEVLLTTKYSKPKTNHHFKPKDFRTSLVGKNKQNN